MADRMPHSQRPVLDGPWLYGLLGLCVLAAGVGGWALLREDPAPMVEEPPRTEVTAPVTDIREEPPVVETARPVPVPEKKEPPPPMPEAEIDDVPVVAEAPKLIVEPLRGEVVAAFSVDELTYSETLADWRVHDGVDIAAEDGAAVLAACSGTVREVADDALMGTKVVIDHAGGYQTTYANLRETPEVEIGDSVSAGQIIGAVGTTAAAEAAQGAHLHFAVTKDGDAVDPDEFLNG